jgi:DNA-binding NarL/FixJ family response regulator
MPSHPHIAPTEPPRAESARVLLADIPGSARRAIAGLVADIPGATLAGQVDSPEQIPDALRRVNANVLVIDDRLLRDDRNPMADGGPLPQDVRLIVLGMDDSAAFPARALRLGAEAWISKDAADDALRRLLAP